LLVRRENENQPSSPDSRRCSVAGRIRTATACSKLKLQMPGDSLCAVAKIRRERIGIF
jgi:hypothetical protein